MSNSPLQRVATEGGTPLSSADLPRATPEELQASTEAGAKRIFRRFVAVTFLLSSLVGAAMVVYDVSDTFVAIEDNLQTSGKRLGEIAQRLAKQNPRWSNARIVAEAAALTKTYMALIDRGGRVAWASMPQLAKAVPTIYGANKTPPFGIRLNVTKKLGELSGLWTVMPLRDGTRIVTIAQRLPESEGSLKYMTIGAGIMALGLGISFLFMLVTANWVLHQPLKRLVEQLTGALRRDNERRRAAEKTAIAARMEAESQMAFRENLMQASDWVGIVATDVDDKIQIFNRAATNILGYTESEIVGVMTLDALRRRTHREPSERIDLRSLVTAREGEEFFVDKNGVERLVQVNMSDIFDGDGERAGRLLVFIDVTERKRLEAELQVNELQLIQASKMASLGEMATGVAHELNQPLNNIGLLASRVSRRLRKLEGASDDDQTFVREKLEKVQGQVARASKIIDQLRTFGHPGSGVLSLQRLSRPVENVTDLIRQQLTSRGIDLTIDLPDDLPPVRVDEAQLEQVLINLLNNARDALTEHGAGQKSAKPRITIEAGCATIDDDNDPWVKLEIGDNGPGIPHDVLDRIFQPFFTTKEVGKGTGLGLAISYSLVQGFGGRLEVWSKVGRGTMFTLWLRTTRSTGEHVVVMPTPATPAAGKDAQPEKA